jgi:NADH-quinone oxidoreductase subunit D
MDYLSPIFNETAYCLGVEKLLGITNDVTERATVIRVMMMEFNRISTIRGEALTVEQFGQIAQQLS